MTFGGFINEINRILQENTEESWLGGVCMALAEFLNAGVKIFLESGDVVMDVKSPVNLAYSAAIVSGGVQLATIGISRDYFSSDEEQAIATVRAVCITILTNATRRASAEKRRRAEAVRAALNSLSFSELEAAADIIKTLSGREGVLVAGHTADRLGFTRSVVVNALRKLEGAGTIETRSLGMKGTYIRINEAGLVRELEKL